MRDGCAQIDGRRAFGHSLAKKKMTNPGMSKEIQIIPLSQTSKDISRFLNVSYPIYENDPHWVAPLLMDLKKVFTRENPLFEHARMQLWVARDGQRDVGRIAGIVDEHFNRL